MSSARFFYFVRIVLPVVFTMTVASIAFARAPVLDQPNCAKFFEEMAANVDREILDADDIARIHAILDDPKLTMEAAADKAFAVYVDRRLESLPLEVQSRLMEVVNFRFSSVVSASKVNAEYVTQYDKLKGRRNDNISIIGPERFVYGAGGLFYRAHELEHAIVEHTHRMRFGHTGYVEKTDRRFAMNQFYDEMAAMRAEWNLLQAIPEKIRLEMADEIERSKVFEPFEKEVAILALRSATLSRDEYVRAHHRIGRYALEGMAPHRSVRVQRGSMNDKATSAIGAGLVGLAGATSVCLKISKDPSWDQTKPWYQTICKPIIDGIQQKLRQ